MEGFTKDNINNDLMMELNQTLSKGGLRLLVIDHTKFNHVDKRVVVVEKKEEREEEREEKKRESKEGGGAPVAARRRHVWPAKLLY